jgi:ribonuclease HII
MTARFDPTLLPPAPDLSFERPLWEAGVRFVAGIDEAGRGALAGPVAAGVVILPGEVKIIENLRGITDSKQMTPAQREEASPRIREAALAWAVGFAHPEEIDTLGIIAATRLAIQRAVENLPLSPDHLLLDCLFLPENPLPQTSLIKGDCRSLSIAAASVLAKTSRDAVLRSADADFPGYGFALHKGYGTAAHRKTLCRLGPCALHRRSFRWQDTDRSKK